MLRDGFLGSPWPVADTARVVDRLLAGLGAGGLANMDGLAVGPFERDSDAILSGKRTTYPFPAQLDPGRLELEADGVDQLVGEHGDGQMTADPIGLAMEDRAQPKLGFKAANDRLQVCEHGVGPP